MKKGNCVWHNYFERPEMVMHEVTVREFDHPTEGKLFATFLDWRLLTVVGSKGPVDFQLYPEDEYFSVGNYVTSCNENDFIKRGM